MSAVLKHSSGCPLFSWKGLFRTFRDGKDEMTEYN